MSILSAWMKCTKCGKSAVKNPTDTSCRCGGKMVEDTTRKIYRRGLTL